jgi:hypothetical protein
LTQFELLNRVWHLQNGLLPTINVLKLEFLIIGLILIPFHIIEAFYFERLIRAPKTTHHQADVDFHAIDPVQNEANGKRNIILTLFCN